MLKYKTGWTTEQVKNADGSVTEKKKECEKWPQAEIDHAIVRFNCAMCDLTRLCVCPGCST